MRRSTEQLLHMLTRVQQSLISGGGGQGETRDVSRMPTTHAPGLFEGCQPSSMARPPQRAASCSALPVRTLVPKRCTVPLSVMMPRFCLFLCWCLPYACVDVFVLCTWFCPRLHVGAAYVSTPRSMPVPVLMAVPVPLPVPRPVPHTYARVCALAFALSCLVCICPPGDAHAYAMPMPVPMRILLLVPMPLFIPVPTAVPPFMPLPIHRPTHTPTPHPCSGCGVHAVSGP